MKVTMHPLPLLLLLILCDSNGLQFSHFPLTSGRPDTIPQQVSGVRPTGRPGVGSGGQEEALLALLELESGDYTVSVETGEEDKPRARIRNDRNRLRNRDDQLKSKNKSDQGKQRENKKHVMSKNSDQPFRSRNKVEQIISVNWNGQVRSRNRDDEVMSRNRDDQVRSRNRDDNVSTRNSYDQVRSKNRDDQVRSRKSDEKVMSSNNDDKVRSTNRSEKLPLNNRDDQVSSRNSDEQVRSKNRNDHVSLRNRDDRVRSSNKDEQVASGNRDDQVRSRNGDEQVESKNINDQVKSMLILSSSVPNTEQPSNANAKHTQQKGRVGTTKVRAKVGQRKEFLRKSQTDQIIGRSQAKQNIDSQQQSISEISKIVKSILVNNFGELEQRIFASPKTKQSERVMNEDEQTSKNPNMQRKQNGRGTSSSVKLTGVQGRHINRSVTRNTGQNKNNFKIKIPVKPKITSDEERNSKQNIKLSKNRQRNFNDNETNKDLSTKQRNTSTRDPVLRFLKSTINIKSTEQTAISPTVQSRKTQKHRIISEKRKKSTDLETVTQKLEVVEEFNKKSSHSSRSRGRKIKKKQQDNNKSVDSNFKIGDREQNQHQKEPINQDLANNLQKGPSSRSLVNGRGRSKDPVSEILKQQNRFEDQRNREIFLAEAADSQGDKPVTTSIRNRDNIRVIKNLQETVEESSEKNPGNKGRLGLISKKEEPKNDILQQPRRIQDGEFRAVNDVFNREETENLLEIKNRNKERINVKGRLKLVKDKEEFNTELNSVHTKKMIKNNSEQRKSDMDNVVFRESSINSRESSTANTKESIIIKNVDLTHLKPDQKIDKEVSELVQADIPSYDLKKALKHAELTWAQDPFRQASSVPTGKPIFDIDFSKNPAGSNNFQPISTVAVEIRDPSFQEAKQPMTNISHPPQISESTKEIKIRRTKNVSPHTSAILDADTNTFAVVTHTKGDAKQDIPRLLSIEDLTWTPALLRRKSENIQLASRQPKKNGF
eukprot:GFUD01069754.1.p1 GENE.GFUD01069754.1~~GFUD01069754.1.p1  ORF type:complete len:997 (-),score=272.36 GFUD01069754.1:175-3165(-)